ncbi:ATP-binding protein [Kitasatospora sp. NPDC001540]|uniref:ATP-binding protein n=1 Tax=Kitasatospora sp. NPDC001540 TaxID=3364014 RepID=UPI003681880C
MTDTRTTVFDPDPPSPGSAAAPDGPPPAAPLRERAPDAPVATAAQARRFVQQLLHEAGPVTAAGEANALLAVSELVTNANRHAGGVTAFSARTETAHPADGRPPGLRLRITVEDADSRLPHSPRRALLDPTRPGGRGWALVVMLATTCEISVLPGGGKRISVTLPL